MPTCDNCGEHVSAEYARVLGHNGTVDHCPNCPDHAGADPILRATAPPQ